MRWLLIKDLQILRRSKLLVGLLVVYPVVIALLIGLALSRGPGKPKVAFLNLVPPSQSTLSFGNQRVDATKYTGELFKSMDVVPVHTRAQAIDDVRSGRTLAALIIPPDLAQRLSSGFSSANIQVIYNGDALKQSYVESTINSTLADANAALAELFKRGATSDVNLLVDGGNFDLLGRSIPILGLRTSQNIINAAVAGLPPGSAQRAALARVANFAGLAVQNLGLSKQVLSTVASPLNVQSVLLKGRRTPLDAFGVAIAVTVSLMFVCVLLAAGMLALEREENAFARLVRGLVSRTSLLTEKVVLAAGCAFAVTLLMLMGIGAFVGLAWDRFPLWLLALAGGALAFSALGVAIGGLAKEVRAASLLAFLLSLPLAFLALVPSGAVAVPLYDVIRVISALFPFKPALEAIDAALNQSSPSLGVALVHLAVLVAAFGVLARLAVRRFA